MRNSKTANTNDCFHTVVHTLYVSELGTIDRIADSRSSRARKLQVTVCLCRIWTVPLPAPGSMRPRQHLGGDGRHLDVLHPPIGTVRPRPHHTD